MNKETAWIKSKRRKGRVWFFFLVAVIALVVAIVIRNNREVFKDHGLVPEASDSAIFSLQADDHPSTPTVVAVETNGIQKPSAIVAPPEKAIPEIASPKKTTATDLKPAALPTPSAVVPMVKQVSEKPKKPVVSAAAPIAEKALPDDQNIMMVRQSIGIEQITCSLRDRPDLTLFISVELFFESDTLRPLLMIRREDIKIMVQKVISRKQLNDVVVESVRRDIIATVNQMLKFPYISDVEFRDFRIEKATQL